MFKTIVVGRDGTSISGQLLTKYFLVYSTFGQIEIETKKICWIHIKNPPFIDTDQVWTVTGDLLKGQVVVPTSLEYVRDIIFQPEGGKVMEISFDAIHTIIVNQMLDPTKGFSSKPG